MLWYVWIDNQLMGWVLAATEEAALGASHVKFPGWGIEEDRRVELRGRKRKRRS